MNAYRSLFSMGSIALLCATALPAGAQDDFGAPPAEPAEEQPVVLSRGPVHEAFAEPVPTEVETGLIAPQQPPPNISEVPPAERPKGQQYVWIPGYWAWDAERADFIWVSACWRAAPPDMSWVPGYWAEVAGGWEWVSGFWTRSQVQNIVYLPEPPQISSLDPVGIQPSADAIWVPPCMYWAGDRYTRRDGYWLTAMPNWIWIPSHYAMTPRGYVFVAGHWDYPLERRGVLFAPVYFPAPACRTAAFTFSPGIVIDLGLLQVNLFTYPRYRHYYFGDYYDRTYLSIGIYPWFDSRRHPSRRDPLYEHNRWLHHRSDPKWEQHMRDEYRRRSDNKTLRPAHTFREQESRRSGAPDPLRRGVPIARPLNDAVSGGKSPMKFERISTDTRQQLSRQSDHMRKYLDDRTRWESPAAGSAPSRSRDPRPAAATPSTRQSDPRPTAPAPSTRSRTEPPKSSGTPSVNTQKESPRPSGMRNPAEKSPAGNPAAQPIQKGRPATQSDAQQRSAPAPSRQTPDQPQRIRIPESPVSGTAGRQGFSRKSPPKQPSAEIQKKWIQPSPEN